MTNNRIAELERELVRRDLRVVELEARLATSREDYRTARERITELEDARAPMRRTILDLRAALRAARTLRDPADAPAREPICECVKDCAQRPASACSLSGDWHVHPLTEGIFGPCPVHPDAPGDA